MTQPPADATKARLEDQIGWYDKNSGYCQRMFKSLKLLTLAAAALIPLFAGLDAPAWATGALGALVVVLEATQQLNQYHANWNRLQDLLPRPLKHEKHLHLALAGPYADVANPDSLLAGASRGPRLAGTREMVFGSTRCRQGQGDAIRNDHGYHRLHAHGS
jgi:hypothetical protein